MGFVTYTIFITIIVAVLVIAITKFGNKTQDLSARKLKIVIPEDLDYDEVFNDIFKKYTNKVEILKVKTTNMGSMYELIYAVSMKINLKEKDFLDEIRCRNGNMLVSLERQELSEVEL